MALTLNTDHLKRYKDIGLLLMKYGRSDLVKHAGLADAVTDSEALTRLQDKVEPFSYAEVEAIVISELGVKISKAFLEFEKTPIAAAACSRSSARRSCASWTTARRPATSRPWP